MARIKIVCDECGSDNVVRDAWAEWDVEKQEWVLRTVFDFGKCEDCEAEDCLEEEEIKTSAEIYDDHTRGV
jgi:hypothetical protein